MNHFTQKASLDLLKSVHYHFHGKTTLETPNDSNFSPLQFNKKNYVRLKEFRMTRQVVEHLIEREHTTTIRSMRRSSPCIW